MEVVAAGDCDSVAPHGGDREVTDGRWVVLASEFVLLKFFSTSGPQLPPMELAGALAFQ